MPYADCWSDFHQTPGIEPPKNPQGPGTRALGAPRATPREKLGNDRAAAACPHLSSRWPKRGRRSVTTVQQGQPRQAAIPNTALGPSTDDGGRSGGSLAKTLPPSGRLSPRHLVPINALIHHRYVPQHPGQASVSPQPLTSGVHSPSSRVTPRRLLPRNPCRRGSRRGPRAHRSDREFFLTGAPSLCQ